MPTYEEVLVLARRLSQPDQMRLLGELTTLIQAVEVEGTTETISIDEIIEHETALQAYRNGVDPGFSAEALKLKLFGGQLG